jgi:exopolysaccharide biosynthesis polyprenyl glycosylphosphotransferase
MSKAYKIMLFISDFLSTILAFFIVFLLRYRSGLFPIDVELYLSDLWLPALALYAYWLIFYLYNGLYHLPEAPSRTDENFKVFKATSYGVILLFLLTFDMFNPFSIGRLIILIYWFTQLTVTAIFRSILLSIRHNQFKKGIGLTPGFIVGCNPGGYEIYEKIKQYPALGYNILGFISTDDENEFKDVFKGIPIMGKLDDIKELINEYKIKQLIIAFGTDKHDKVLDVIFKVSETKVGMKILPDMYDIFSGLTRTQQIIGVPLIDINPNIMTPWEKLIKRSSDIILSVLALLLFLPFGLIISLLIKLDSKGPVFYTQERLGRAGKSFKMIKFRSMKDKANVEGGKVIVTIEEDNRITKIGQFIRRFRIDEIPQLINVLKGDMSIIGPRPDLQESTDLLEKQLPLYRRRLRVKPGITGWAQISVPYPMTLEEHNQKLACDIYYIENMSLKLDLKIMLNTVAIMFSGSGT